jgi:hypothetical protein
VFGAEKVGGARVSWERPKLVRAFAAHSEGTCLGDGAELYAFRDGKPSRESEGFAFQPRLRLASCAGGLQCAFQLPDRALAALVGLRCYQAGLDLLRVRGRTLWRSSQLRISGSTKRTFDSIRMWGMSLRTT